MNIISDAEVAQTAKSAAQAANTETVETPEQQLSEAKDTLAEIGDEADASKTESEAEKAEATEKSNRAPGAEKRIKKLSREKNALKGELEYWRNEAMKKTHRDAEKPGPTQNQIVQGKPKADEFNGTHEEFVEALTDWKIEQREVKKREEDVRTSQQRQADSYIARKNEFAKAHDDFEEVTEAVSDIQISLTVQQLLLDEGGKPELAYALAKDREEYKRICSLAPLAAARELGKFEAKLVGTDSSKTIEPKKITKAPKPIAPVGTKAKSDLSIYDQELSQSDFERLRAEQIKQKRN